MASDVIASRSPSSFRLSAQGVNAYGPLSTPLRGALPVHHRALDRTGTAVRPSRAASTSHRAASAGPGSWAFVPGAAAFVPNAALSVPDVALVRTGRASNPNRGNSLSSRSALQASHIVRLVNTSAFPVNGRAFMSTRIASPLNGTIRKLHAPLLFGPFALSCRPVVCSGCPVARSGCPVVRPGYPVVRPGCPVVRPGCQVVRASSLVVGSGCRWQPDRIS
jgi:hypothetical protein